LAADFIDWLANHDWSYATSAAKLFGGALAMGFGAIGAGVGEGITAGEAIDSGARQPAAAGELVRIMLIGQAIAETSGIFALVIAFVLMFGAPEPSLEMVGASIGAGLAMGLGAIGSGVGAGIAGGKAAASIGRNPRTRGTVTMNMLIGQALTTSPAVFCLVVSVLLAFAQQLDKYMGSTLQVAVAAFAAGLCVGAGGIGPGFGTGLAAGGACDAIGRNPDVQTDVTRMMLVGGAVSQSTAIYAFVISLLLILFV
jgi:ATP synthase F0 subunit c